MGDDFQEHCPGLSAWAAGGQGFAESAFDHAHNGFDLPSLPVGSSLLRSLEVDVHLPSMARGRRLGGWATGFRRNHGAKAEFITQEHMDPLSVIPRVAEDSVDHSASRCRFHRLDHVRMVGRRSAPRDGRQNDVAGTVADQPDLGKSAIGRFLPLFSAFGASAHEIVTGVMGFKTAAVDGGQRRSLLEDLGFCGGDNRLIQHAICGVFFRSRSAAF